ncbi:PREDICTED: uncharacterized protein LOC106742221 [Dinoponera quadriceps]|uniref:Uncharacterized protein LOC106742221 n=1 Tax=Dinoponera quadriceps TaxID=609295 RepID=A0A6P3WX22_DINQU|nr:PREDICTED: uncharacterized protein LOC106742221 [Dinoponera quadriceps]
MRGLVILMAILPLAMQKEAAEGPCSCAAFDVSRTEPIMEYTLQYNMSCDREGIEKCERLCIALAENARDKAPTLICEKLNAHVENLKIAVYAKACDMTAPWTFTGLESAEFICCHEGKATICDGATSVIENQPTVGSVS